MRDARGLTLTELVIVMALASLVMVGLVTFYISSQGTWFDGSAQAMTQRDATLLMERITSEVHASAAATVTGGNHLVLFDAAHRERGRFWLETDSLVHYGTGPNPADDRGAVVRSRLAAFDVEADSNMIYVDSLAMRTQQGDVVQMSSKAAFYQRP